MPMVILILTEFEWAVSGSTPEAWLETDFGTSIEFGRARASGTWSQCSKRKQGDSIQDGKRRLLTACVLPWKMLMPASALKIKSRKPCRQSLV